MALVCIATSAQTYDKVFRRNPWNDGNGFVGIRQDSVNVAVAEASGSYENGGYRTSSQAETAWTAGARAAAVRHLEKFSMAGSFSFEQFWGHEMMGSMFVRPGFFPVDIYEFTPGDKDRQTYSMTGALSVDLSPEWRIGGGVDFTSCNFAKLKDLRHSTYMLDFSVKPGVQYHRDGFAIGLNYIFNKTSETVAADQIGVKSATYDVFLDKGLFYGEGEVWTGSGVHLQEPGVSGFPISQTSHGLSLQMSGRRLYAGLSWNAHSGKAGEKDRIWFRYRGYDLGANIVAMFPAAAGMHRLRGNVKFFRQANDETVLERINEGGVTTTTEHGANQLFLRTRLNASLEYDFNGRGWNAGARLAYAQNEGLQSGMYPYLGAQVLKVPSVEAHGAVTAGAFDLRLSLSWANASLSDDLTQVTAVSGVVGEPKRLERFFVRFREHATSDRINLAPSVRYNFCKQYYFELAALWQHGFDLIYLGNNRINTTLKFGYNF